MKKGVPTLLECQALVLQTKIAIKQENLSIEKTILDFMERRQLEAAQQRKLYYLLGRIQLH